MTTVSLVTPPILQFFNNAGQPNAGGSVLTQVGGINYPTYQDAAGSVPLPNPIPLNGRGEISNSGGVSCQLFGVVGVIYTFTMYDAQGNQIDQSTSLYSICPSTVGTGILKGDNAGGTTTATSGTDYVIPSGTVANATTAAAVTNGGALNTPASGNLANCTFPTLNQNTSGTAANATLAVNCTNAIGYSQTWQDVTGSRSSGVGYTNSTGKPIMVAVSATFSGGISVAHLTITVVVASVTLPLVAGYADSSHIDYPGYQFIVPVGAAYSVTVASSGGSSATIQGWAELR